MKKWNVRPRGELGYLLTKVECIYHDGTAVMIDGYSVMSKCGDYGYGWQEHEFFANEIFIGKITAFYL